MANAQTSFKARLSGVSSKASIMPLTHTTSTFVLQKVLDSGVLKPRWCETLKEDLVYLFYGRAAYRSKRDFEYIDLSVHAPIVLIFNPNVIAHFRHIYPFDTGNYPHGYMALTYVPMEDFRLDDLASANKAVELFWNTRWDYIRYDLKNARRCEHFAAFDSLAQLYSGLLHNSGSADDRRGTIELTCSSDVLVNSTTLLGVVVPTHMMDDPGISSLGTTKIATYDWCGGRGIEYFSDIQRKVWGIFKDLGI